MVAPVCSVKLVWRGLGMDLPSPDLSLVPKLAAAGAGMGCRVP